MHTVLALDLVGWLAACADIADARIVSLETVSHPRFGQAPDWKPGKVPRKVRRSWTPPDEGSQFDNETIDRTGFVHAPVGRQVGMSNTLSAAMFVDPYDGVLRARVRR